MHKNVISHGKLGAKQSYHTIRILHVQASQKGDSRTIERFALKKKWKEINSTFDKSA